MDYHFRGREYIEGLCRCEEFGVFEVRGDVQALGSREVERKLAASDMLFKGNPFIGSGLLDFVREHGLVP